MLLPAMMSDARMWRLHLEAFALDRAMMVAPTHAAAQVGEAAAQVLDAAPRRFALAGLGLGAVVAMEVMRREPGRVTRAALLAADALAETPAAAALRETAVVAARAGRMSQVLRAVPGLVAPGIGPLRDEALALARQMAEDLGPETFVRQVRMLQRRPDQQRTLRQFPGPILLMVGDEDGTAPRRHQDFLVSLVPGARLEVVPGAGHLLPVEAPGAVALALDRWLRGG